MFFLEVLKSVLIGIVQGITEWLPVSSTGHMILLDELIHLKVSDQFNELFRVVIQLGSILAVIVLYFSRLWPFGRRKTPAQKRATWQMWFKVLVGIIPLMIVGLLLDDWLNAHLYNWQTVAVALIVYGVLFIVVERFNRTRAPRVNSIRELSYADALKIGLFQVLSVVPGTSRSGSTILGSILLGVSRPVAAEFSFFMAVPVMIGASGLKTVKYIARNGLAFTGLEWAVLLVGTLVAFLVSVAAIKFLMKYIKRHDFSVFGVYRIVLGLLVLLFFSLR